MPARARASGGVLTAATAFTRKDALATTLFRTAKAAVGRARNCTCCVGGGRRRRQYRTTRGELMHVAAPHNPPTRTNKTAPGPVMFSTGALLCSSFEVG